MTSELQAKYSALKEMLTALGKVAIAFSGGIDSTLLLKVAHDTLGDSCVAFTAASAFVPDRDVDEARQFCEREGITLKVMDFPILDVPHVKENPTDRCYHCKTAIFTQLRATAGELGITNIAEGTNLDDDGDYRPGRRALEELHTLSPLHASGFTKKDIRALSQELGIKGWDRPSSACLASRFAYGMELTADKLKCVGMAENFLKDEGFHQLRVRVELNTARIELEPADIDRLLAPAVRAKIVRAFREFGFSHVSLDLLGYRKGSMNEGVEGI